jgi:hypothetical protein
MPEMNASGAAGKGSEQLADSARVKEEKLRTADD